LALLELLTLLEGVIRGLDFDTQRWRARLLFQRTGMGNGSGKKAR